MVELVRYVVHKNSSHAEAVVVRGLYTLKGVVYHAEFDRQGSSKLTHLISELTEEVRE